MICWCCLNWIYSSFLKFVRNFASYHLLLPRSPRATPPLRVSRSGLAKLLSCSLWWTPFDRISLSLWISLFPCAKKRKQRGFSLSLKNANIMLTYPLSLLPIPDLIPANSSSSSLMATANYNYCYNNNSKSLKTTKTLGLSFPTDSLSMRRKSRKPICVEPSFSTQKQGI